MMQALVILPARIEASLGANADGARGSRPRTCQREHPHPIIGRLGEAAGKRRMMLASLATVAAGMLVCADAGNWASSSPGG